MKEKVLVVEDDIQTQKFLATRLGVQGFEVLKAASLSESFLEIVESAPNIILAGFQLKDGTAFDLLDWLKSLDIHIPLLVLVEANVMALAEKAVVHGAEHLVPKPIDLSFLTTVVRRSIDNSANRHKASVNNLELAVYERDPFLGSSPAILELRKASKWAAGTDSPVLIQGEVGTGKGALARWLHKTGPRCDEVFVNVRCARDSRISLESEIFGFQKGSFPGASLNRAGRLEIADRGTLFLDEIGNMDAQLQPKFLKALEDKQLRRFGDVHVRKVDVRIIASTDRDLKRLADSGEFRNDLYSRISTLQLRIPPLRERREDLPIITDKLLEEFSTDIKHNSLRISDKARSDLERYSWPGNIRELRGVLERSALLADYEVIHDICISR